MGVPKGLLMAANPGMGAARGPMAGALKAVKGGKRIGPAGPGTTSPGKRRLGGGAHMQKNYSSVSAFGVDHGGISKADDKYGGNKAPTGGRRAAAYAFGPFHSAVAGKKGKKLRATGNQIGGSVGGAIGGQIGGAALGALTRKPAIMHGTAQAGGLAGGIGGSQLAVNRNQRKGYYKPQKKGAL